MKTFIPTHYKKTLGAMKAERAFNPSEASLDETSHVYIPNEVLVSGSVALLLNMDLTGAVLKSKFPARPRFQIKIAVHFQMKIPVLNLFRRRTFHVSNLI